MTSASEPSTVKSSTTMPSDRRVAYFSMEISVDPFVPTYSGGLGILAGDTVRSAADLGIPFVAVTLLSRQGYFFQRLDGDGNQTEEPVHWQVDDFLTRMNTTVQITLEGRSVSLTAWMYSVVSPSGFSVPVYFLDTDLPENELWDRQLTGELYGGDPRYRLAQEALLGIGGVRLLRALGYDRLERFHMNEGHASLLTIELLQEEIQQQGRQTLADQDIQAVRQKCVFTTHTPVVAGHDAFDLKLVEQVLGHREECGITDAICHAGQLNMTYLGLALSHFVNGVAKKHSEVSRQMFAQYEIEAITNGVHAVTWVCPPMADLFDRLIKGWRNDNFSLRYALSIADHDLWKAHRQAKRTLIETINQISNAGFDTDVFTLGFGRRATGYKRTTLILEDIERLRKISKEVGRLQLVFAGKAHPNDDVGKELIRRVVQGAKLLGDDLPTVYLPNYEQTLAAIMTAGADVWLNTPEPPLEASGTSGVKAALNGVPSLSVLDGWWIEGCVEGITGWSIGQRDREVYGANADSLYQKLEQIVVPTFYRQHSQFISVMRHAIALNGAFFNTQRMVSEYATKAYQIGPAFESHHRAQPDDQNVLSAVVP